MTSTTDEPMRTLEDAEAWEFLRRHDIGRLGYQIAGDVYVVPVNYVVWDGRLVFRTAEGSKLFGVTVHESVAFEVDEHDDELATSVMVRGRARHLEGREADAAAELPLHPWVPGGKQELVGIEVLELSGRAFRRDAAAFGEFSI